MSRLGNTATGSPFGGRLYSDCPPWDRTCFPDPHQRPSGSVRLAGGPDRSRSLACATTRRPTLNPPLTTTPSEPGRPSLPG